jgi:hypothetical protein
MSKSGYDFFIAGIIQGSRKDLGVEDQSYRTVIKAGLQNQFPGSRIYCPVENHPESVQYSDEKAASVFMKHVDMIRHADCLIVYLPEASMGSAVEMWEARHAGTRIITVTPMTANWVIRLCSDVILETVEALLDFIQSGKLEKSLKQG